MADNCIVQSRDDDEGKEGGAKDSFQSDRLTDLVFAGFALPA